jgi:transcriptional regulator with GAF, ATPase, and Fis domain
MARQITGMQRAALILQANGKDKFQVLTATGEFDEEKHITDKNIITMLNMAGQLRYPLDISRTNIPSGKISEEFLKEHPRIICTPLWIKDEVTGFLYLDSPKSKIATSDEDHSFLVAFSQQVALALERILLSERVKNIDIPKPEIRPMTVKQKERFTFQDIIGNSQVMKNIYELVDGIKDMDTTVLLTGENGTGKDLIAKTIHYAGSRKGKPFVSLNCSAFPGELLESQLFGYEKGAFTGAHRQSIGHFESANGGTIFLNEIGDMPPRLQPKLLRVLEEQKFYRVGGTREITTNVRIITATNKDLLRCMKQGTFREDLYYRINIFPIRVPPLRERRADIEALCNHFLTTYCRLYNIPRKKISLEAMTCLVNYEWPGNVRELENTINRMIILTKKDIILPEDLPEDIVKYSEVYHTATHANLEESIEHLLENTEFSTSDPILPKVQGMLIRKIVEKTGDKTKAAALLGISKPTLYSKLRNNENKH